MCVCVCVCVCVCLSFSQFCCLNYLLAARKEYFVSYPFLLCIFVEVYTTPNQKKLGQYGKRK